ncbi:MAG: AI-2E family transporter [Actinomycetaceae bacterium]|nr:AI-2E family transporter [Actinomycetaceae bacterium]
MANKHRAGRISELFERFSEPLSRARASMQPEPVRVERIDVHHREEREAVTDHVSWPLRVAAAWSWRLLVLVAALLVVGYGISLLTIILIPVLLALLFAVLLDPINRFLRMKIAMPRAAAAAVSLLVGVGIVVGLVSLASSQIMAQFEDLVAKASDGLDRTVQWLTEGPLQIQLDSVQQYVSGLTEEIFGFIQSNSQQLASGAMSITTTVGNVLTGTLVSLFVLFFFLKDGRQIWLWFVRLMPKAARVPVHESAIRGWVTLGAYARTQILVAALDAFGIGLGAFLLGVPLAIPLAVLVFIGSFVPIVGAFVTGSIAVLVALVDQGLWTAFIMLIVILAVQQIEGNLLQPWLMSNAVSLHPVAVLLAVMAGSFLFGIPGALFAVPVVAFINTSVLYLYGYDKFPELAKNANRPGGPPGNLSEQIMATYAPNVKRTNPELEPAELSTGSKEPGFRGSIDTVDEGERMQSEEGAAQFSRGAVAGAKHPTDNSDDVPGDADGSENGESTARD